tara:strand:+ start:7478 stop:8173 length:696 start_codon:yes stop_codon:yes gene_type:complete
MEVTSATASQTDTQGKARQAEQKLAEDFDDFLALLTTQLQYQDPLDPLDSNEFTQQLVSFTGVEQSIATNKNLETLISKVTSQSIADSVSYLGKEITVDSNKAGLDNGKVKWEYTLDSVAETTKIKITHDKTGKVVYEGFGKTAAGMHEFVWQAPENAEEGIYSLEVSATTASDQEVQTQVYSKGIVKSVETLGGLPYLASNGILVAPDNILAVKDVTEAPPPSPGEENAG